LIGALTFARATGARPLENFTTEALAAAIASDPSPFLVALESVELALPNIRTVERVQTQVHVPGGVIDLEVVAPGACSA
jgi:hypothetical protein